MIPTNGRTHARTLRTHIASMASIRYVSVGYSVQRKGPLKYLLARNQDNWTESGVSKVSGHIGGGGVVGAMCKM